MSRTAVFNTLRLSNRLKEAGLPNEQAEALAHALEVELNGDTKVEVARERGALAGEVRVLKWAAGIALAFIFGAFAILYQGQAAIISVQTDLRERVTRVEERLTGMEEHMDGFEERLDGFDERLDGFDERLDGFERRLDGFDERLGRIEELLRILVARQDNTS